MEMAVTCFSVRPRMSQSALTSDLKSRESDWWASVTRQGGVSVTRHVEGERLVGGAKGQRSVSEEVSERPAKGMEGARSLRDRAPGSGARRRGSRS